MSGRQGCRLRKNGIAGGGRMGEKKKREIHGGKRFSLLPGNHLNMGAIPVEAVVWSARRGQETVK